MIITVPVSIGEVVDKLTILDIKLAKIVDEAKLTNIRREYDLLDTEFRNLGKAISPLKGAELLLLASKLKEINETLWTIEDDIRDHEARHDFGESFIKLARSVYRCNDIRATIKRNINCLVGSTLTEEKSYKKY